MNGKREDPKTKQRRDVTGEDDRDPERDEEGVEVRDEYCDAERGADRDEKRDNARDTKRDRARDEERDSRRDEVRDEKRDTVRDAQRDQTRDAGRDEDRDAESAYDLSVGQGFESIRARKESSLIRDGKRDEAPDAKREASHDDASLIVAMAEECGDLIRTSDSPTPTQPASLRLKHLEWMCSRVAETVDRWPKAKSHQWLGFVLAGMIANRLFDLDGAKEMLERVKQVYPAVDQDLLDHLDPDNGFEFDIGGEG